MAVILPSSQSAFVDADGKPTPQFYSFLNDLSSYFHVGSGAPAFIAPQGALYLRTDGSTVATRAYVSKSGTSASWAAVTTTS
jgi:hypothetical protein